MSQYNQVKTSHAFHGCAKIMLWLHAQRTKNPDTSQTHLSAFNFHEYHSDTSRHQPNIPKTSPGSIRCQQTKTDANRPHQTYSNSTCQCPGVSGAVCLCLLMSVGICWHRKLPGEVLGMSGGCLVGVWRCLSGIHGNWRHSYVFGGYLGSKSLQYGTTTLVWHSHERHDLCSPDYTETSKYQNVYI